MSLPRDLAPVLSDGVVLCHLANHVRPRAVASVHVPSPAQVNNPIHHSLPFLTSKVGTSLYVVTLLNLWVTEDSLLLIKDDIQYCHLHLSNGCFMWHLYLVKPAWIQECDLIVTNWYLFLSSLNSQWPVAGEMWTTSWKPVERSE